MITLKKLASLKSDTRRRKFPLLLQHFEEEMKRGVLPDKVYFSGLVSMIEGDEFFGENAESYCRSLIEVTDGSSAPEEMLWRCNSLRHKLLSILGAEPGDWDFSQSVSVERGERVTAEHFLYLDGIRSPFNVGSIFRSAESFGIRKIFLSPETCSPEHPRAKRSSMGCTEILPWSFSAIDELPGPFFALELGGVALDSFRFPGEGFLIIGSEELGVSPLGLEKADGSLGRLSIVTGGLKGSINVSVASGIALQKWFSVIF